MVTLYYDDTTRQDVANSLPTSGEGRRVMQMYMFVTIHGSFPLTFVQKSFVPVEVVDRQAFWGGLGPLDTQLLFSLR